MAVADLQTRAGCEAKDDVSVAVIVHVAHRLDRLAGEMIAHLVQRLFASVVFVNYWVAHGD